MRKKICIVTGAQGSIGSNICRYFKKKKWTVIKLSSSKKINTKYYNLNNPKISEKYFVNKADLLVHCAYEFGITDFDKNYNTNVNGSLKTFKIAKNKKIKKIINISTMSSFQGCKSIYGKIKFEIEKKSYKLGVYNLRCGLYVSNKSKLYSKLKNLSEKYFFFPLVGDGSLKLHLMKNSQLIDFIIKIHENKIMFRKFYFVGNKEFINLKNLILSFSKKKFFIYINKYIIKFTLDFLFFLKIKTGFTSDNLLGLTNYNENINFEKYKI